MKYNSMDLSFGSGIDSVIYDCNNKKFMSYQIDRYEIHNNYGGKQYYLSKSGLSGAGYIEHCSDLIEFGHYRTDTKWDQERRIVSMTSGGCNIYGYAPINSHCDISEKPFVLTDGCNVAFVRSTEVEKTLCEWDEIFHIMPRSLKSEKNIFRDLETKVFDKDGYEHKFEIKFYNPDGFNGLRITRFIDLEHLRNTGDIENISLSPVHKKLNVVYNEDNNLWFRISSDGLLVEKFEKDPIYEEEFLNKIGWKKYENMWSYRRPGDCIINVIIYLNGGIFYDETEGFFYSSEHRVPVIKWYNKSEDSWYTTLSRTIYEEVVKKYNKIREDIKEYNSLILSLKSRKEMVLSIKMTEPLLFCEGGVDEFIKEYGLTEGMTVEDLLNKNIAEMFCNRHFRRFIKHIIR